MAEERVRIVVDLSTAEAKRATQDLERTYGASVQRMDTATKGLERSQVKMGETVKRSADLGTKGIQGVTAGIGAATAAAAASEGAWLSLGNAILGAFAAGGPIAGGIAIIGAGIGMLVKRTDEAGEAAKRAKKSYQDWLAYTEKALEGVRGSPFGDPDRRRTENDIIMARSRRDSLQRDILEAEARAEDLRRRIAEFVPAGHATRPAALEAELDQTLARLEELQTQWGEASSHVSGYTEKLRQMGEEEERLRQQRAMASDFTVSAPGFLADQVAFGFEQQLAGTPGNEIAVLQRLNELKREKVILERYDTEEARARLRLLPAEVAAQERILEETRKFNREMEAKAAAEKVGGDGLKAGLSSAAATAGPGFLDALRPTLSQGIASLVQDGITTGFENGAQIASQIVNQMLNQMLNELTSFGVNSLFSLLGGGGSTSTIGGAASLFTSILPVPGGGASAVTSPIGAVADAVTGGGGCAGGG